MHWTDKHVLCCTASHCAQKGANDVVMQLRREVLRRGLDSRIFVNTCGTIDLCDVGPNIVVYPDGVIYAGVTPKDIKELVDALAAGQTVERLVLGPDTAAECGRRNLYAAATDPAHPDVARLRPAVALLKDRIETLAEAPDLLAPFLRDALPPYDPSLLVPKKLGIEETIEALVAVERLLDEVDLDDEAATEARFRALVDELGLKAGQLFMAIRVAITGRTQSPGLFETMRVIGKPRCRARTQGAIELLRQRGDEELSADD